MANFTGLTIATESVRNAHEQATALGFRPIRPSIHSLARELFDRIPGEQKLLTHGNGSPFWTVHWNGVDFFCDEPPIAQTADGSYDTFGEANA